MELHQTMARHRKTLKLSKNLKISRRETIGLLIDLWTWGMDNANKDGLLVGLEAEDIAAALDYPRKRGDEIVSAIEDAGYIESSEDGYILHDWYTYCGKLNDKREDTKRRVEAYRSNRKKPVTNALRNADVTRTVTQDVTACNASTVPYSTVPNIYTADTDKTRASFGTEEDLSTYRTNMATIEDGLRAIGFKWNTNDENTSAQLMADYSAEWLIEAIKRTGNASPEKQNWAYIKKILANWRTKGGMDSGTPSTGGNSAEGRKPANVHGQDQGTASGSVPRLNGLNRC